MINIDPIKNPHLVRKQLQDFIKELLDDEVWLHDHVGAPHDADITRLRYTVTAYSWVHPEYALPMLYGLKDLVEALGLDPDTTDYDELARVVYAAFLLIRERGTVKRGTVERDLLDLDYGPEDYRGPTSCLKCAFEQVYRLRDGDDWDEFMEDVRDFAHRRTSSTFDDWVTIRSREVQLRKELSIAS